MVNVRGIEPSGGAINPARDSAGQTESAGYSGLERTEAKKSEREGATETGNDETSPFFLVHRFLHGCPFVPCVHTRDFRPVNARK